MSQLHLPATVTGMFSGLLMLLMGISSMSTPLAAQQVALQEAWSGAVVDGLAGTSVALLGDLDGDGVDDLAWGEPRYTLNHVTSGRVVVRSGADGTTLASLLGAAGGDRFGASLAGGGDFDGDGTPDFAVGSPGHEGVFFEAGLATVYSGASFLPLMTFEPDGPSQAFGFAVDFVADLDGDGDDEVLVGAPYAGSNGLGFARLYAGGTGAVLATYFSGGPLGDYMGLSVADVGDVNDDGFHDLGVGAPDDGLARGRVLVFSGRAVVMGLGVVVLLDIPGPNPIIDAFGLSLDGAGDLDGDDHDDIVVGNPFIPGQAGMVTVHSGATGAEILRFDGTSYSELGHRVAGLGDLDGDGVPDVGAVGRGAGTLGLRGLARAWSGASGDLILHVPNTVPHEIMFSSVAPGGDRDGDGRPEVIFGVAETFEGFEDDVSGRGKLLRVERDEPLAVRGHGLRGEQGLPWLAATGDLTGDSDIEFHVVGGLPSAPLFFVVGVSEVFAPVEGGVLVPAPDFVLGLGLDAAGGITLGGSWPAGVPAGLTVSFQGWIADAGGPFGFAATNGTTGVTP